MDSSERMVPRPRIGRCLNFYAKHREKKDAGSPGHCKKTNKGSQNCERARKRKRKAKNWAWHRHFRGILGFSPLGSLAFIGPWMTRMRSKHKAVGEVTDMAALRIKPSKSPLKPSASLGVEAVSATNWRRSCRTVWEKKELKGTLKVRG